MGTPALTDKTSGKEYSEDPMTDLSFAARFSQLAQNQGDQPALSFGQEHLTFAQLHEQSIRMAHHLQSLGVGQDDFVTVAEPNSVEFVVACVACWQLGATPQPVSARLPPLELQAIVDLAKPKLVIGVDIDGWPSLERGFRPADTDTAPLPDAIATSWKAPTSGGSTGRPKLIVSGDPSVWDEDSQNRAEMIGASMGGTMIMPGPLYHNGPFIWSFVSLLAGTQLVLLPRFDAEGTLAAIEQHQGTTLYIVPTMMQRICKLSAEDRARYDLSSLKRLFHLAEPCPAWVKEEWIEWLGAEVVWELYGGTEGQAATVLSGTEWLEHRGSVGRPVSGEIVIRDDDGNDLPFGETGDVWMRPTNRDSAPYHYIGAEADNRDGWECLGDVGWMDDDGYLYLADRRKDMILVGGANVYPAEVEAAINAHQGVQSSAVIGLPDEERGNHIHAIVQPATTDESETEPIDTKELRSFLADRLVSYKIPRSFEYIETPLRDDAGKVRRAALREARL